MTGVPVVRVAVAAAPVGAVAAVVRRVADAEKPEIKQTLGKSGKCDA